MTNKHQLKIQLNADALRVLFPEGSEAEVELRKAVIANFVQHRGSGGLLGSDAKAYIEDRARETRERVDAALESELQTAMRAYTRELGVFHFSRKGLEVSDDIKVKIKSHARDAVMEAVGSHMAPYITDLVKNHVAAALSAENVRAEALRELKAQVKAEILAALK